MEIDIDAFFAADFGGRIRLVNETYGARLWSQQLAEVWTDVLDRLEQSGAPMAILQRQLMRELMALAPDSEAAEAASRAWVGDADRAALPQSPSIVHLIVSCEKYKAKAIALYETLAARFRPLYILIGDSTAPEAVFDDPFLKVPALDNYEGLTWKILEGLIAVRRRFGRVAVLKLDDDTFLCAPPKPARIADLMAQTQYAGTVCGGPDMDRCWHAGKCERQGDAPYGRRFQGPWVGGARCYLGPDAVDCLVREALFFPGEFEGEIYEDKAVGDALRRHGILPTPHDMANVFGVALTVETPPDHAPLVFRWTRDGEDSSFLPTPAGGKGLSGLRIPGATGTDSRVATPSWQEEPGLPDFKEGLEIAGG